MSPAEHPARDVHVHSFLQPMTMLAGWIVCDDHEPVVIATSRAWADRLAVLIERHGFADVPDTPAALIPKEQP